MIDWNKPIEYVGDFPHRGEEVYKASVIKVLEDKVIVETYVQRYYPSYQAFDRETGLRKAYGETYGKFFIRNVQPVKVQHTKFGIAFKSASQDKVRLHHQVFDTRDEAEAQWAKIPPGKKATLLAIIEVPFCADKDIKL